MTPVKINNPQFTDSSTSEPQLPLWSPSKSAISQCQMTAFMHHLNKQYNLNLTNYWQLYEWSIREIEVFWKEIWNFTGIQGDTGSGENVLEKYEFMDDFPKWFKGRKLNFAKNLLFPKDRNGSDRVRPTDIALHFRSEIPELSSSMTWQELRDQVAKVQFLLKNEFGIKKGDRIGAYAPNCPEVLIYMLAGASLGAIFTAGSPDFGPTVTKKSPTWSY